MMAFFKLLFSPVGTVEQRPYVLGVLIAAVLLVSSILISPVVQRTYEIYDYYVFLVSFYDFAVLIRHGYYFPFPWVLLFVPMVYALIVLQIKRLRTLGHSQWWLVFSLFGDWGLVPSVLAVRPYAGAIWRFFRKAVVSSWEFSKRLFLKLPWYIKALPVILLATAYFALPYYEAWRARQEEIETRAYNASGLVWNESFRMQVYNVNDELLYGPVSIPLGNTMFIANTATEANDMKETDGNYASNRTVTLTWNFNTKNYAQAAWSGPDSRGKCEASEEETPCPHENVTLPGTCYFKTVELPPRMKGQHVLLIGIYDKNVLRMRWSDSAFGWIQIQKDGRTFDEAWQYGLLPLPSDWWVYDDEQQEFEPTTWNEAVDGPTIDEQGKGAWLTLKADYSKPCEE